MSNLTCNWTSVADSDGHDVINITNWYKNNESITLLYLPFEGYFDSNYTKDYSGYGNDGIVLNTFSTSVAGQSDDAEEDIDDGAIDTGSSDLEMTYEDEAQVVGIRFQNINVPQGATIIDARIEFTCDEATAGDGTVYIYGEDADDTVTFGSNANNITNRPTTSNYATWTWKSGWTQGTKYNSTDT